jgi:predicted O-methyltransferase YrrM
VLARLLHEKTVVSRPDGTVHDVFPVAIGASEGAALRDWVEREEARATIEIGLGYAMASMFICEGLLAAGPLSVGHVAIDPFQQSRFGDCGLDTLEKAGLRDLVEFHGEESQLVLPRLLQAGRSFDLAFVDGNHRYEAVFVDLTYLGRLVRPGGAIFVDDYQLPAIARAVSFFVTNLDWTLEESSTEDELHNWAVLRTSDKRDTRPFDHFVDF